MRNIVKNSLELTMMSTRERVLFLEKREKKVLQNKKSREKPKSERRSYGEPMGDRSEIVKRTVDRILKRTPAP